MLVLLIIAAAVALLVHGTLAGQPVEVLVALGLSVVGIGLVLGERYARTRAANPSAEPDPTPSAEPVEALRQAQGAEESAQGAEESAQGAEDQAQGTEESAQGTEESAQAEETDAKVVFAPGRTTFHRATCSAVAGKPVSAAERSDLEAGGMTACRRCLVGV